MRLLKRAVGSAVSGLVSQVFDLALAAIPYHCETWASKTGWPLRRLTALRHAARGPQLQSRWRPHVTRGAHPSAGQPAPRKQERQPQKGGEQMKHAQVADAEMNAYRCCVRGKSASEHRMPQPAFTPANAPERGQQVKGTT